MALESTAVTVPPNEARAGKERGNTGSIIIYGVMIVLIFLCAIFINLVLDADSAVGMWVMTMFGAFVISLIISGAAIHSLRHGPF